MNFSRGFLHFQLPVAWAGASTIPVGAPFLFGGSAMALKLVIPENIPEETRREQLARVRRRIEACRASLRDAKSVGLVWLRDIRQLQAELRRLRQLERAWLEVQ